jgi:outer membrane protein TolC
MRLPVLRSTRLVIASGLMLGSAVASAQSPTLPAPKTAPFPAPAAAPPAPVVMRYTLGEALAIAHERHPQLAALRASMNAALVKQRGIGEVKRTTGFASGLVIPDYEFRMQQSDLGLRATMAEYAQARHEVNYAVVRCFYTVVYAREQAKVARDLVEQLEVNLEQVKKIVSGKGAGVAGITKNTEDNLQIFLGEARGQLILAETGTDRARAALREALGLDPLTRVDAADEVLPEFKAEIKRDAVIALAVTMRGEVKLAEMGADVSRLEVCAQWARRFNLSAGTYAEGADIHSRPIPAATRDPDYKPGAIGPEMPVKLVGNRDTRAQTAGLYAERATEAARQARSLIGLEAEVGYTRWVEATRKVEKSRIASKAGRELLDRLRQAAGGKQTKEDLLINEISATRAIASMNEALYDQIIAIANLERITAGGVTINFAGR